jgi:hypothetical protein
MSDQDKLSSRTSLRRDVSVWGSCIWGFADEAEEARQTLKFAEQIVRLAACARSRSWKGPGRPRKG